MQLAQFNEPQGIALCPDGRHLVLSDRNNDRIRRVDTVGGAVVTIAGDGVEGFRDGPALARHTLGAFGSYSSVLFKRRYAYH